MATARRLVHLVGRGRSRTKERDAYGVMQWTGAQPKVTGATLWPLPPMTLEELVKANLITTRGINHAAYERAMGSWFYD